MLRVSVYERMQVSERKPNAVREARRAIAQRRAQVTDQVSFRRWLDSGRDRDNNK